MAGLAAVVALVGSGFGALAEDVEIVSSVIVDAGAVLTANPSHDLALVDVSLDEVEVAPVPCSRAIVELSLSNPSDKPIYADALITAEEGLNLSARIVSSYLPAGYTFTETLWIQAESDVPPGTYEVVIASGDSSTSVTVEVGAVDSDNVALTGEPEASSMYPGRPPCGAVDGVVDSELWTSGIGWSDSTNSEFPDWWSITFPEPVTIGRVDLYTVDSADLPAETQGMRDWDIEVRDGQNWRAVAEVRENTEGMVTSTFPAEQVTALRVLSLDANGNYSRIVELEAYEE